MNTTTGTATVRPVITTPFARTWGKGGFSLMTAPGSLATVNSVPAAPNACGAVGPAHIVEISMTGLSIFSLLGEYIGTVTLDNIFRNGVYPRYGAYDVRLMYDHFRKRYVAAGLERGMPRLSNNGIVISYATDPTKEWTSAYLPVGEPLKVLDFLTMGVDSNGYSFGAGVYGAGYATGWESARYILATPDFSGVWSFVEKRQLTGSPVPAITLGDVSPKTHFIASDSGRVTLSLRTFNWVNGAPILGALSVLTPEQIAYVPLISAKGSLPIDPNDHRMHSVIQLKGKLYAARHFAVGPDGHTPNADRSAIGVYTVNPDLLTIEKETRIFEPATKTHYYLPCLTSDRSGRVFVGFNGSNDLTFPSCYLTALMDEAPGYEPIKLIKDGEAGYIRVDSTRRNRWGDFNTLATDPLGNAWAFVEYTGPIKNDWAIWAHKIGAAAPPVPLPPVPSKRTAIITYPVITSTGKVAKWYAFLYDYQENGTMAPLAGLPVKLTVAGQSYTVNTELNGRAVFLLQAPVAGEYTGFLEFAGTEVWAKSTARATLKVSPAV